MTAGSQGQDVGKYADVNGLKMYYEVHGSGQPLVLLHGGISTIDVDFGRVLPGLAEHRQVIAIEQQGHGHTADIDRPLTIPNMAGDTAELLRQLKIENADFFGYSVGADIALQLALTRPELVRKLVFATLITDVGGQHPGMAEGMEGLQPEHLAGSPFEAAYAQSAPNPADWPKLIEQIKEFDRIFKGWTHEEIQTVKAPALLIYGDSDIARPEHAVELFRLFGGGVAGDAVGLPASQLAILPGTTHITLVHRADWLVSMILPVLDAATPEGR